MVESEKEGFIPPIEEIILNNLSDLRLAEAILAEAAEMKGGIASIRYRVKDLVSDSSGDNFWGEHFDGVQELRERARTAILVANGVNKDEADMWSWKHTIKERVFRRNDSFSFVVWRNPFGDVVAQGEMKFLIGDPVVQKFLSLCPTRRDWQAIECWEIGIPERFLNEDAPNFTKIEPKSQTFLFSDEREKLKRDGSLVTYQYHSIYQEAAEAYFIYGDVPDSELSLVDPRQPICLYRARAQLLD